MIKNILPALLAASISDFDTKVIRKALQSFVPGPELTPGRMNIFDVRDFKVMIDYVHNPDGFRELGEFMKHLDVAEKVGVIGCAGDRRDQDIREMGSLAARIFDKIIIRHDKDGRGRSNEELTQLIVDGINQVKPGMQIEVISDETEALAFAMERAHKGTFIVVSSDNVKGSTEYVMMQKTEDPYTVNHI
jgi:cyanophycin synthetase